MPPTTSPSETNHAVWNMRKYGMTAHEALIVLASSRCWRSGRHRARSILLLSRDDGIAPRDLGG